MQMMKLLVSFHIHVSYFALAYSSSSQLPSPGFTDLCPPLSISHVYPTLVSSHTNAIIFHFLLKNFYAICFDHTLSPPTSSQIVLTQCHVLTLLVFTLILAPVHPLVLLKNKIPQKQKQEIKTNISCLTWYKHPPSSLIAPFQNNSRSTICFDHARASGFP